MPDERQATSEGFSSNSALALRMVPPAAGMIAIAELLYEGVELPIALSKAI